MNQCYHMIKVYVQFEHSAIKTDRDACTFLSLVPFFTKVGTRLYPFLDQLGVSDLRARHITIWNDTEKISMAPCARMTRITWVDTPIWGSFFCMYLFYFFVVCYSRLSSSGGSLLAVVVVVVTSSGGGSGVWYVKSFSGPSSTFSA